MTQARAAHNIPRSEMTWLRTFAEVHEVLRLNSFAAALHYRGSYPIVGESLLTLVGEEHLTRRRSEIVMFSRAALTEYELGLVGPAVQEALDELAVRGDREADLLDITRNALLRVSARIVGLDGVGSNDATLALQEVAGRLGEGASVEWATSDADTVLQRAIAAKVEFAERFYNPSRQRRGALVAAWRAGELAEVDLPNDLLTILLRTYDDWDEDKLLRECIFFLVASSSTTTHSAPHTLRELTDWLARHPEDADRMDDLSFLQRAVSEALRLHPPVPALLRIAMEDTTLSTGRDVRAGEALALDLNAANTDPAVYGADAASFNPHRALPSRTHMYGMSFGAGPHTCPGRLVAVGGGNGSIERDDLPVGVLTRLMRELHRHDIAIVPAYPPVLRTDTVADRFATFPISVRR